MGVILGVVSAKGGVGKTTTVINLGAVLANDYGKNVLILDTNITTGNLGLSLGLSYPATDLPDVLKSKMSVLHSIYTHPTGLHVIPSSLTGVKSRKIDPSKLRKRLKQLLGYYDFILLDSAPGAGIEAQIVIRVADELVLVITPDFPTIGTALKTIGLAKRFNTPIRGVILNRGHNKRYEITKKEIEASLGLPVISVIPEDLKIQESVSVKMPVTIYYPKSPASAAFKKMPVQIFRDGMAVKKVQNFFDRLIVRLKRLGKLRAS